MKIICIGRNYPDPASELNHKKPSEPVVFLKPDTAQIQKKFPFVIPSFSNEIHHEIELLVKICKVGKHISTKFAPNYYDEIGLGIDFTARDVQSHVIENGLPWEKAKAFDGSALIGDFLPKSTFKSLQNINFELHSNGRIVQQGNTNLMLWKIDELIAHVSQYFTLKKGDIIFTGTPKGVAQVKNGDELKGFLEGKQLFKVMVK
ncbi:MAG TPA: 2-hydroxyhepta-2,4-diene-1,7-dioate isomerase [Flavobacterium sp.]|nr:2-hydroxyhepta-2,4-diene-1,7-dioate isomerase [Flavobacterium sp.]